MRAESLRHVLFDKRDPKLLWQEPGNGAEMDSQAALGKVTIAGADRRGSTLWCSGCSGSAQQAWQRFLTNQFPVDSAI
jgi:hypothetical protein